MNEQATQLGTECKPSLCGQGAVYQRDRPSLAEDRQVPILWASSEYYGRACFHVELIRKSPSANYENLETICEMVCCLLWMACASVSASRAAGSVSVQAVF